MKNNNKYLMGALLVLVGIAMIFGNFGFFSLSWLTGFTAPMIIIMISGFFFLGYTSRRPNGAGLLVPAGVLFTVGATLFLSQIFGGHHIWPGYVASPAVGLLLLYLFGERSRGLLVPIGTLFALSSVFFLSNITGLWNIFWPGFILAPAIGLFLLYLSDTRNSGLLIPVFILTSISIIFFAIFSLHYIAASGKYIFGAVLILGGLSTILRRPSRKDSYHNDDYPR